MQQTVRTPDFIESAILAEVKRRLDTIVAEEVGAATMLISQQMHELLPNMAVKIMRDFDMTRQGDFLTIRVRIDNPAPPA